MSLIKITKEEIENKEIIGTYLYSKKDEYYFYNSTSNVMFTLKNGSKGDNLTILKSYLLDVFELLSKENKNSKCIYFRNKATFKKVTTDLGNQYFEVVQGYDASKDNSIYFINDNKLLVETFKEILTQRNDSLNNDKLFIVLDKPEKVKIEDLVSIVTIGRSRKVYFIINIEDEELFKTTYSIDDLNSLKANCNVKFICNNGQIEDIEAYKEANIYEYKMNKQLQRLEDLHEYIDLLPSNKKTIKEVKKRLNKDLPSQFEKWLEYYDGGFLFSIQMFYTSSKIKKQYSSALTYKEVNSKKFAKKMGIPLDIKCFAMTNYGNYYCFAIDEDKEMIYEWDNQKAGLIVKWNSFTDWLKEMIDNGESDIKDNLISKIQKN